MARKSKKLVRKAKPTFTPEQIANDPSLRWFPYRQFETVWSDDLQTDVRFYTYEDNGQCRLATLNGMAPLEGIYNLLSIRRQTAR